MNHRKQCTIPGNKKYACHSKSDMRNDRERLGTQHPVNKSQISSLSGSSKCLECGKIVLTKNMSRHMREKHPSPLDRPFGDERYKESDSSDEDPKKDLYRCDICDKTFKSARSIPTHVKKIHQLRENTRMKMVNQFKRSKIAYRRRKITEVMRGITEVMREKSHI